MSQNLSSAAVVIGALRVKMDSHLFGNRVPRFDEICLYIVFFEIRVPIPSLSILDLILIMKIL